MLYHEYGWTEHYCLFRLTLPGILNIIGARGERYRRQADPPPGDDADEAFVRPPAARRADPGEKVIDAPTVDQLRQMMAGNFGAFFQ